MIEGLLNAVHLDHLIELEVSEDELLKPHWRTDRTDQLGRKLLRIGIRPCGDHPRHPQRTRRHRACQRNRAFRHPWPRIFRRTAAGSADYGGIEAEIESTPRRLLRRVKVTAPYEMTAFARTSGDFNPIHTSHRGAAVSGLAAPLVHGMWLSATAQYAVQALDGKGAHYEIAGWTYNMYGMVQLDDEVEISVERVGRVAHLRHGARSDQPHRRQYRVSWPPPSYVR